MTEMSRAGVGAADPGPPTSSSPTAPGGAEAPDGMTTAPALGACWRPMNVDERDDVRVIPTTRETVPVREGVL